jgi:hypothetical protein
MSYEAQLARDYRRVRERLWPTRRILRPEKLPWRQPLVVLVWWRPVVTEIEYRRSRARITDEGKVIASAKARLRGAVEAIRQKGPSPAVIEHQISLSFGVPLSMLRKHTRSRLHCLARQLVMALCRNLTTLSLPQIGKRTERHHSCVVLAVRKYGELVSSITGVPMPPPQDRTGWNPPGTGRKKRDRSKPR